MRKDFIYALLLLVVCAGCNNRKHTDADNDADTVKVMLDDRTISFYYNWYGESGSRWRDEALGKSDCTHSGGLREMPELYPVLMMTLPVISIRNSELIAVMMLKWYGNIFKCM